MMRRVVVLTIVIAACTWMAGWWSVVGIGLLWGLVAEDSTKPARTVALAAVVAWSALLLWTAMRGPVWMLSETLAGIFGLPGVVLLGATVLFPAMLAFTSTALMGELRRWRDT